MSTIARKKVNVLISEKLKNRNERIQEAGANLNEVGQVLADYDLYFNAAHEALVAADVTPEVFKSVSLALSANDTEMKLLEQRISLEQELNDEHDDESPTI